MFRSFRLLFRSPSLAAALQTVQHSSPYTISQRTRFSPYKRSSYLGMSPQLESVSQAIHSYSHHPAATTQSKCLLALLPTSTSLSLSLSLRPPYQEASPPRLRRSRSLRPLLVPSRPLPARLVPSSAASLSRRRGFPSSLYYISRRLTSIL